ncbi:hypothetical protein WG622_17310 [Cognatishimia sp. D5M38]|uniref:Uncharacterized protein n=1 Tax=Cognatishimia coralii TaxID=3083254 RepID=A0ABU8QKT7_9RHOB|nr:hypothetical protein [Donghicola eburneus]MCI5040951.1 hypothetical protein [Donghicola eburneus]
MLNSINPCQFAMIGMLALVSPVSLAHAQESEEGGSAATQQLRALKAKFEQEMVDLEEIERHILQLSTFYKTDAEGAFQARLPISECTKRAGSDLCAALWPFYEDPSEVELPLAALQSENAGAGQ